MKKVKKQPGRFFTLYPNRTVYSFRLWPPRIVSSERSERVVKILLRGLAAWRLGARTSFFPFFLICENSRNLRQTPSDRINKILQD
ncbi:MAG: hypothetical protein NTV49_02220 [Kiritimatiellaeota bacterium]|nr:hypothetical protein [Kiritimatiellota bacterium]